MFYVILVNAFQVITTRVLRFFLCWNTVDIALFGASAEILFIAALLVGVYAERRLGSQEGEGRIFFSSMIGKNSQGSTVVQVFRMVKSKIPKI